MISVLALLWLLAFLATVASAVGRAPLWVAVLLITVAGMIGVFPLR